MGNSKSTKKNQRQSYFCEDLPKGNDLTLDDVKMVKTLGKGSFGTVSHVLVGDQSLALKIMSKRRFLKPTRNNSYLAWNERSTMLQCSDSNFVVSLEAALQTEKDLYMFTPYYSGGDMLNRLKLVHGSNNAKMTSHEVEYYLAQMVIALEDLQNQNICHRDIKPDNIFFDGKGNCVLGDMGLATKINDKNDKDRSRRWGRCGSYGYRAPEVVMDLPCGYAADIYSLGITFYFYAFGGVPWSETKKRMEKEARMNQDSLFFPNGTSIGNELCDLLAGMLAVDEEDRLTLDEIKLHPALAWVDWEKLAAGEIEAPWKPAPMLPLSSLHKIAKKFNEKEVSKDAEPLSAEEQESFLEFEYLPGCHLQNPGAIDAPASKTQSNSSSTSSSPNDSTPPQQYRQLGVARSPFTSTRSLKKYGNESTSIMASKIKVSKT